MSGTINIMLHIDADLAPGALVNALVTCTEAKTAAVQELLAPSRYSHGLATGSGQDGTIVISNPESPVYLTNAGKHCKLGEYIGLVVKKAVKQALYNHCYMGPEYQHDILNRMDRFGITRDHLWERYQKLCKERQQPVGKWSDFVTCLDRIKRDDRLVTYTSLFAHLLDQMDWGMLGVRKLLRRQNKFCSWRECRCNAGNPVRKYSRGMLWILRMRLRGWWIVMGIVWWIGYIINAETMRKAEVLPAGVTFSLKTRKTGSGIFVSLHLVFSTV